MTWIWEELDAETASMKYDDFCERKEAQCSEHDLQLRTDIIRAFDESLNALRITREMITEHAGYAYKVDCLFGIRFYELVNEHYGMNPREASKDGVWRNLCTCVVPDLVAARYGIEHPDRFWLRPKRVWLRCLWWYIHLSWQGDKLKTNKILKDNNTDQVLQLVDRCGLGGYRVSLYREIMRQYSLCNRENRVADQVFRKVMMLNTARAQVIDPDLVSGGVKKYVSELFMNFGYETGEE